MRANFCWWYQLVLITMAVLGLAAPISVAANVWDDSKQLVVITSADWSARTGQMQRYYRVDIGQTWIEDGPTISVSLGKAGMAWGMGLHGKIKEGPQKIEGDGKTPAGIFRLSSGFGYADANDETVKRFKFPYLTVTSTLQCVDDPKSALYNRIVDRAHEKNPDWSSFEDMHRHDELYRWGIVIDQNSERVPGAGSCVFMHIWRSAKQATVGCSATSSEAIKTLLEWLDPVLKPVLVQVPISEYARLKKSWGLP